ncbi:MAG TPA: hypothetical protein VEP73_06940 [Actinomycetota bacterium]|nr:hypothetical protein [Actinomycetota bacterium]
MSSDPQRPGLWTRLVAHLGGEVPATTLEAYRRAGGSVYELLSDVEQRRAELMLTGADPWSPDAPGRALELCAWNAFSLQLLGDELLASDYQANPSTVGFVPPVTAAQVHAFYDQVEEWLSRARQALDNPVYRLDAYVPAELPAWSDAERCPREHLEALLVAGRRLRQRAEIALGDLTRSVPAGREPDAARLRQLLAVVDTAIDYADRLHRGDVGEEVHERIEQSVRLAIETAYLLGQLVAMPALLDRQDRPAPGRMRRKLPLPGQPGFDPWCLTDPRVCSEWQRDPRARRAIERLWRHDPRPDVTLGIQGKINAALARGAVAYATDHHGRPVGQYFRCPWAPIYVARRPITIAGRRLETMQQFTLDISAEPLDGGGKFRCRMLRGPFEDAEAVDW